METAPGPSPEVSPTSGLTADAGRAALELVENVGAPERMQERRAGWFMMGIELPEGGTQ